MNAPLPLPALDDIRAHEDEMVAIRRRIHANPELAFEERATSDLVAECLQRWGYSWEAPSPGAEVLFLYALAAEKGLRPAAPPGARGGARGRAPGTPR